jgi:hypothetical protein
VTYELRSDRYTEYTDQKSQQARKHFGLNGNKTVDTHVFQV